MTDDTAALQSALNANAGKRVILQAGASYMFTSQIAVPPNTLIETRGARLVLGVSNNSNNACISFGVGCRIEGALRFLVPSDITMQRGIILNDGCRFQLIEAEAEDFFNISNDKLDFGVQLRGNDIIGETVRTKRLANAIMLYGGTGISLGLAQPEDYVCGVYVRQADRARVSTRAFGRSPLSLTEPGNNGLLLEQVTNSEFPSTCVDDAGEHAVRVGGGTSSYSADLKFGYVSARRPGQCAFKVSDDFRARRITVGQVDGVDCAYTSTTGSNEDIVRVELAEDVTIGEVAGYREEKGNCANVGVFANGVKRLTVGRASFQNPKVSALHVMDTLGSPSETIEIGNLSTVGPGGHAVFIDSPTQTFGDIHVYAGSVRDTAGAAVKIITNDGSGAGGVTTPCSFRFRTHNIGGQLWDVVSTSPNLRNLLGDPAPFTHDKTPEETAAGVVIVRGWCEPGDVRRYGGDLTGVATSDVAAQAALDQRAKGGAPVHFPSGTYKQTVPWTWDSATAVRTLRMSGDGIGASIITTALDIEQLVNVNADSSRGIFMPVIEDLDFQNTYPVTAGAGATHFHVHLTNSLRAMIRNCRFDSAFDDTDHNDANHSGIFFDTTGTFGAAFMNHVESCWLRGQVYMKTSDSVIDKCFIWAHHFEYGVKCEQGNINVVNCPGIIGSPSKGGVWITDVAFNAAVQNNFFDGSNDIVNSGHGVWVGDGAVWPVITGNRFWRLSYNGVRAFTPFAMTLNDNQFWDCGRADSAIPALNADIYIEGTSFAPNKNSISGNVAYRGAVRTNPGHFILEANGGSAAVNSQYANNVVSAGGAQNQYASPAISTLLGLYNSPPGSRLQGNLGFGTETETSAQFVVTLTGCTSAPTGLAKLTRQGNIVAIRVPQILGTSNTTAATLTGLPAAFWPNNPATGHAHVRNNSTWDSAGVWYLDTSGVIHLLPVNPGVFADENEKGVGEGTTIQYLLAT